MKAKAFTVRHFAKDKNNTASRAGVRISLFSPTPKQHLGSAVSACHILPLSEIISSSTAAEENASSSEEQLQASEMLKDAGLRNPEVSVLIVYIKVREKEEIPMHWLVHLDQGNPFGQLWKSSKAIACFYSHSPYHLAVLLHRLSGVHRDSCIQGCDLERSMGSP